MILRHVFASHVLASLLVTSAFAVTLIAPMHAFAQDATLNEEPFPEDNPFADESDYQSPAFVAGEDADAQNIPVKGTSDYTFNPVTGLYEHKPSAPQEEQEEVADEKPVINPEVKYRGSTADVDDVDPYLLQGGVTDDNANSRGIRNIQRSSDSKRSNADAYREMMGEEPDEDISADFREEDRSYLKGSNSRRYSNGRYADEPRGIGSNRLYDRYSDEEEYYDEESFDQYGRRVSGYGRDNRERRSLGPKTGNADAYKEMMGEIEGQ